MLICEGVVVNVAGEKCSYGEMFGLDWYLEGQTGSSSWVGFSLSPCAKSVWNLWNLVFKLNL